MTRNERSKTLTRAERYPGYADLEMSVMEMRLHKWRLNWLQQRLPQQQPQPQQNNYVVQNNSTRESDYLPELVGLFDNYSADADIFDWQGNPDIYEDNDDINFSEIFGVENDQPGGHQLPDDNASQPRVHRCFSSALASSCQMDDKETAAVGNEKVVMIDDDSDDDTQPIPEICELISMFGDINPEFTADEARNEKRTNVEAAVESSGKRRGKGKVKTSPCYWNNHPTLQKLECMRAQAKQRCQNPEHDSLAERKIREKLQCLLNMIPGRNQDINKSTADMFTEVIVYLRYLENRRQLLAKEAGHQIPHPENNVNITTQHLAEEASHQNPTPENNANITAQLFARLSEEASRQNPTPQNNVNVTPTSEGNQNLVVKASGGRRRRDNVNKVAAKKMKKKSLLASVGSYPPPLAPGNSVAARNADFAYLAQQAAALYNQNSLAFAPRAAVGTASPSANWSIPQQYVQVPTYYSRDRASGWNADTLSLLYQSHYRS